MNYFFFTSNKSLQVLMKQLLNSEILLTPLRNAICESMRQQLVSYLQNLFFLNEHYADHFVFFEESPAVKKTKPTKRTPKGKKIPRTM
jgi:hypothetical protein